MFYEEELIDGVWYWRSTPDGDWIVKKLQMSKGDEPKWRSKNGHAIASDVTDTLPLVTHPTAGLEFERMIDEHATKDMLAEAVKVIEEMRKAIILFGEEARPHHTKPATYRALKISKLISSDFLAKIGEQNEH